MVLAPRLLLGRGCEAKCLEAVLVPGGAETALVDAGGLLAEVQGWPRWQAERYEPPTCERPEDEPRYRTVGAEGVTDLARRELGARATLRLPGEVVDGHDQGAPLELQLVEVGAEAAILVLGHRELVAQIGGVPAEALVFMEKPTHDVQVLERAPDADLVGEERPRSEQHER